MVDMPFWLAGSLYLALTAAACWILLSVAAYVVLVHFSRNWARVEATLLTAHTLAAPLATPQEGIHTAKAGHRILKIEYTYTLDGRKYTGRNVSLKNLAGFPVSGDSDEVFRDVRMVLDKDPRFMNVFASPYHPGLSVVFRDLSHIPVAAWGIFSGLAVCFAFLTSGFESAYPLVGTVLVVTVSYSIYLYSTLANHWVGA